MILKPPPLSTVLGVVNPSVETSLSRVHRSGRRAVSRDKRGVQSSTQTKSARHAIDPASQEGRPGPQNFFYLVSNTNTHAARTRTGTPEAVLDQCRLAFSAMTKSPSNAPSAALTKLPIGPSPPCRPAMKL